jgi:hypothetical protein
MEGIPKAGERKMLNKEIGKDLGSKACLSF